jgi:hypothetical protein
MVNGYPVAEFSSGNRLAEPTFQFGYKPGRPQRSPDALPTNPEKPANG